MQPITIVYPFAAGGPGDIIARVIAEPMRAALGQPVIVETMPGANGNIGAGRIARAKPNRLDTSSRHHIHPCSERRALSASALTSSRISSRSRWWPTARWLRRPQNAVNDRRN